jgi:hypothetical protein
MEILGDDEEDRSLADRPPVDPPIAWASGTTAFRSAALPDGNPDGGDPQSGRNLVAQRRTGESGGAGTGVGGVFARPLGGRAPVLDLGEQARDPAWEQTWNTGPVPLTTVRVEDAPPAPADPALAGNPRVGTPPGGIPAATPPGGQPQAAQPVPAAPQSVRNQLLGTVASPEAMSVAGVLMAFGTSISSLPMLLTFASGTSTPRTQYDAFAMTFALGGLVAVALGVAACLRLRPDSHPLVRGMAGAAIILGIVLVVLAAFITIQASGVPAEFGSG